MFNPRYCLDFWDNCEIETKTGPLKKMKQKKKIAENKTAIEKSKTIMMVIEKQNKNGHLKRETTTTCLKIKQ